MDFQVVAQKWVESERGWGVRPDGYTLHITSADRDQYIRQYWNQMPDATPEIYSRPDGEPFIISVSETMYNEVAASRNGISVSKLPT